LFAGAVVAGYVMFNVASSVVHSGLDTWLILIGAGVMLAGVPKDRSMWRAAGGIAVLVGVFAPWADVSMWTSLTSDVMQVSGLTVRILWLVPGAGLLGIISAGNQVTGAKLATAAGIMVFGSFVFVIGSVAFFVFGIGAWAALGASTVALAISVIARGPKAAAVPQLAS
jgi:hypothetical protein